MRFMLEANPLAAFEVAANNPLAAFEVAAKYMATTVAPMHKIMIASFG